MKLSSLIFALLMNVLNLSAIVINADDPLANANQTVVGVIQSNSSLTTFAQILVASGVSQQLEGAGPFTVFAPSNSAFDSLPKGTIENLQKKENLPRLQAFVKNHVVSGSLYVSNLKNGNLQSLSGKPLNVLARGAQVQVDDATIMDSDLSASNGVVQVIDTALFNKPL